MRDKEPLSLKEISAYLLAARDELRYYDQIMDKIYKSLNTLRLNIKMQEHLGDLLQDDMLNCLDENLKLLEEMKGE